MTTILREENTNINDILPKALYQEGNPITDDLLASTNSLLLGNISRTSMSNGKTATVKAGEDIRPALESLRSAGGGTLILLAGVHKPTYSIMGGSKINIVGEGVDQTIIDFTYSNNICMIFSGTSSTPINNFNINNLTITNINASNGALVIHSCNNFSIQNIIISNSQTNGIFIEGCNDFILRDIYINNSTNNGFLITSTSTTLSQFDCSRFSIENCKSTDNSGNGFYLRSISSYLVTDFTIINCYSGNNSGDGFIFNSTDVVDFSVIACQGNGNSGYSFNILAEYGSFIGCIGSGSDFIKTDSGCTKLSIIGCGGGASGKFYIEGEVILIGNRISPSTAVGESSYEFFNNLIDTESIICNTYGGSFVSDLEHKIFKNTSGSTISGGSPVVLKTGVSNGYEITTTTTVGDNYIIGMSLFSVANNALAKILIAGKTSLLKVDGTTDIAVGDFLCTYSVAGIAAKAAAGDMAFAIALEAYTGNDSNGVIDALIISPRKL